MSLPREDLRLKLDAEMLEAIRIFAKVADMDMKEYAENILVLHLQKEITKSLLVSDELKRSGISGSVGE
jgi:hypothetical protein